MENHIFFLLKNLNRNTRTRDHTKDKTKKKKLKQINTFEEENERLK